MSNSFEKWEGLTDHVKEYINTRVELTKLHLAEKTSLVVSQPIAVTIVVLFFLLFLIFLLVYIYRISFNITNFNVN